LGSALAGRQTDVGQQVIVQRPQLGDGDPAPAPAGIRLEDEAAEHSRQAQKVLSERIGDTGAAEDLAARFGRQHLLARPPVHQAPQGSRGSGWPCAAA
jgi:hypothetical protein